MSDVATHHPDCTVDPCICEQLEDAMIEEASMPSPAELIRRARQRGLIKGSVVYDYGQFKNGSPVGG